MGDKFSYLDFPDYFYYLDLPTALKDLHISKDGIHQLQLALPFSDAEDRKNLIGLLTTWHAQQQSGNFKDRVWEHVRIRLRLFGLTQKGVDEIESAAPITHPVDRLMLLDILIKWLVKNEDHVPKGYPKHMRGPWKQKQIEGHKQK